MPIPTKPNAALPARTLLRDTVREQLKQAIMEGTFEPGETLHDKELQDWLGVSRTPVRDALNELTRMGLVEMEPNRFTRVANPTDEETTSAMQTLGVIYSGVVRLAVPRLSERTANRIADQLDLLREAVEQREPLNIRKYGFPTFGLFEKETGNPLLVKLCRESVDGLAYKVRSQRIIELFPPEVTIVQVRDLADATRSRDAAKAEAATAALFQLPAF